MGNEKIDPELRQYYDDIDALAERARNGDIDRQTFENEMRRLTFAAILLAFVLGGGSEEVPGATSKLNEQRRIAEQSITDLGDAIYSGNYSERPETDIVPGQTDETGRAKLETRLGLWTVTLAGLYAIGQIHKPPSIDQSGALVEPRYIWRLGNTIHHCSDCATLDGQIHTAEEWRLAGIAPQSPDLECGGWNCDCRLDPTDEPSIGFTF